MPTPSPPRSPRRTYGSGRWAGTTWSACLAGCFPLHPLTALTAGPLFRQLAQNERSLFAFLVSSETNGFQDFLRHDQSRPEDPAHLSA